MMLKESLEKILLQLKNLINQMSQEEYKMPVSCLHNGTIGQHVRHILEFFVCLSEGIGKGVVNYDRRKHDKAVEREKLLALSCIVDIEKFISVISYNQDLSLGFSYNIIPQENTDVVPSNLFRELVYNIEHAVHHMAIIKIGLKEIAPNLSLPADFGIASSTINYFQKQNL